MEQSIVGLAARRADRGVMRLANTSSIRFVAFLALGPSGGQRKPVTGANRPLTLGKRALVLVLPRVFADGTGSIRGP
jgi:hypothetical protein